jgi:acyl-coenzyme A thioesterase PaaI-like protein
VSRKQEIIDFIAKEFPQFKSTIEDVGSRSSVIRHRVSKNDLRPGQTVSGPILFGVADSALYVAILGEIGIVPLAVTTNMNINFLNKPSSTKDIIAKCKLIKVGKNLIVGEVYLYSEGNESPIAHAVGTYSVPPNRNKP